MFKVLDKMIATRLQIEIRSGRLMDESQGGFMEGRSCSGQVLTLETIIETRRQQNLPTYCVFIDIKKAFDSVGRNQLFETMLKRGVSTKTV